MIVKCESCGKTYDNEEHDKCPHCMNKCLESDHWEQGCDNDS
jgi:endogenous inhibitor of DNA gyrase (YacG/DUF329 family)